MKGTSKVMMGATVSIVMILAIVLGLVLILLAELYCSILLRRRKLRSSSTRPSDEQPQILQSYSTTPSPLTTFYCHGVLEAPRSFLFPNVHNHEYIDVEKQKHAKLHQFLRVQSPLFHVGIAASTSSPFSSSTLVSSSSPKHPRRKKLPEICPKEEEEEGYGDDHIYGTDHGGMGPPWPKEEEEERYGDDHIYGRGQGGMAWPKPHKEKYPEIGLGEEEEGEGYGNDHIDGMGQGRTGGPPWPEEEEEEGEGDDDIYGMTNTPKFGPPWAEGGDCWSSPMSKMLYVEKVKGKDMNRDDGDDVDGGLGGPPWSEDEEGDGIDGTGGPPWPEPHRKRRPGARPGGGEEVGPGVMYISNPIYEGGEVAGEGDTPAFGTPESSPSPLDGGGGSGGGSSGDDEMEEASSSPGLVPLTPMKELPPPRCSTTKGKKAFRVGLRNMQGIWGRR